jgi:phospholipase C
LPPVINTSAKPPEPDSRFPAQIPNGPFDLAPFVPPSEKTGDLVHRFYQQQMQINDGAMNRFAAISDAGGLVMGYYDMHDSHEWRLASEFALADNMFHGAFGGSFLNHA